MSHLEERFLGRDGLSLYQQCWLPESDCRALVIIVHGLHEHSGRYARLAADLNRSAYAVYSMDLRGHGRSAGRRAWIVSFDEFLDDAEILINRVAQRQPGKPIFLLGHSMGGLILAWLAINKPPKVKGLIFSGPAILVGGKVFPILRHFAAFFSRIWPGLSLFRLGCRFISRDPQVVEDFKRDPLVFHGAFPIRTGAEILHAAKLIQGRLPEIHLPILVMHGAGDVVADPKGAQQLYAQASSTDKTLRLYDGLYHEIFSEPERAQVVSDLLEWLNARV
ncbi:MAG TPA: lysophospholipase [Thermoguttaceae bacterium]